MDDTDWEARRAAILAEYQTMFEQLPISDEPSPPLDVANPTHTVHTRRDTKGNVYGYFPGCKTEGMLGWVENVQRPD